MKLTITGRHVEISTAFHTRVEENLNEFNETYHIDPVEAIITLAKENNLFTCHLTLHLGKNMTLRCHAEGIEAYQCFDNTLALLVNRLRRHKKRVADYHKQRDGHEQIADTLPYFVLNGQGTEEIDNEEQSSIIIAEQKKEVPSLTVGDAVMHLDLSNENAMVFRNKNHGKINFIYRRSDGNIGWIDVLN
ncbi:MAG: ribosome-associated translation inhibitor RaiA [Candidatus Paracaedimonas acanthamoebae]|uniref:Ribosome hibernation promoting factor n=1 Tax=Candidatus Paracaedimonas acanthamoebae TaxID=244581 RepID=A0A8J7TUZ1_9PROT|nr:ribosome-associated translation inhibitor RaiA [Candidatus Paracaedimonas acanthamoebae]